MALRKMLAKRLFTSPLLTPENSSILRYSVLRREGFISTGSEERRFVQRRGSDQLPPIFQEIFSVPVGEKLREKLLGLNINPGDRLAKSPPMDATTVGSMGKISVEDARKLLRVSQMENLKARLRGLSRSSISYYEFVQICREGCGNEAQAIDLARTMDQSGNVVVIGNVVFLRPEQMAKSMATIISESLALPNDPRRKELEEMEEQKALIDKKAKALVRGELYCGLGFLMVQTLGFMRLTFWELSWDVMEPICFFVTSLHFALAYGFFLRTSTEPSFEGYFQRRLKSKQVKLMKADGFDIEKYHKLRQAFYPNAASNGLPSLTI